MNKYFCTNKKKLTVYVCFRGNSNRGIKTQRTIKTKLSNCMNGLPIMIGQLGFVQLTNRKMGRKNVNKRINRALLILFLLTNSL